MKLNVYYDLKYVPCTFDFATYLVLCNAIRQDMNLDSMAVNIICGEFRKRTARDHKTLDSHKNWRVHNILSRLPFLIPEVTDLDIIKRSIDRIEFPAFPGGYPSEDTNSSHFPVSPKVLEHFVSNKAINLRPYRASEEAKKIINSTFDDNVITITLRTSKHNPIRNSNLDEWYKVSQELKNSNFRPIIIPDFDDYMNEQDFAKYDWEIYAPAIIDLDLRLALYEKAYDNLCINNGTSVLLHYSDCKYRMFKIICDTDSTTPEFYKTITGLELEGKYEFATSDQHFIWEDDSADIILKHL